jgi:hypothetical protein
VKAIAHEEERGRSLPFALETIAFIQVDHSLFAQDEYGVYAL